MTNNNEGGAKMEVQTMVETKVQVQVQGPVRRFHHEGLAAYGFARAATQFVLARRAKLRGLPGEAGPQLERAVVGAQTNLCSGAAHGGAEARRHFRNALSEATEAGGALDIVFDSKAFDLDEYTALRTILLRLCATLYGLSK